MSGDACDKIEFVSPKVLKQPRLRVPAWINELVAQIAADARVPFMRPDVIVTNLACETTFGGRWFAHVNTIAIVLHPSRAVMRGVVVHEMGHWKRWVFGGDEPGEHDARFYALMEQMYPRYDISFETARTIEHAPPAAWSRGKLW